MLTLNKTLIFFVVVIALIFAEYNFYFKPKFKEEKILKAELSTLNREIETIMPRDINSIRQKVESFTSKIPNEEDLPFIIKDLVNNSSSNIKIDYEFLRPLPIVSELNYKKMPLDMGFSGSPTDFLAYLEKIGDMKSIVRVDAIEVGQENIGSPLKVKLTASIFFGTNRPKLFYAVSDEPIRKRKRKHSVRLPHFKGIFKGISTKAFIDDSILGIGDTTNGYVIGEITSNYVVVLKSGKSYTLKLGR